MLSAGGLAAVVFEAGALFMMVHFPERLLRGVHPRRTARSIIHKKNDEEVKQIVLMRTRRPGLAWSTREPQLNAHAYQHTEMKRTIGWQLV